MHAPIYSHDSCTSFKQLFHYTCNIYISTFVVSFITIDNSQVVFLVIYSSSTEKMQDEDRSLVLKLCFMNGWLLFPTARCLRQLCRYGAVLLIVRSYSILIKLVSLVFIDSIWEMEFVTYWAFILVILGRIFDGNVLLVDLHQTSSYISCSTAQKSRNWIGKIILKPPRLNSQLP